VEPPIVVAWNQRLSETAVEYTAEDIKNIASLYFEGADLSAVLEVVEKVENDSHVLETINTDPAVYLKHPATMKIYIGASKCLETPHRPV
jgi:hypothetical protein